jgi:MarR family transcriptional regulator, transcriptional regulator for hemolysin
MTQETPRERVGRLVQHVARDWRRAVDARMAPLGLTDATWLPLLYLARVGPGRQGEVADYLGLDRSSVVRLIDALADQGLVTRQGDANDRRIKRIVLTKAAGPVVRAAEAAAAEVRVQAMEGLEPGVVRLVEAALETILVQLQFGAEIAA